MAKQIILENKGRRVVTATPVVDSIPTGSLIIYPGVNFIDASLYASVATDLKYKFDDKKDGFKLLHIDKESTKIQASIEFSKLDMDKAEDLVSNIFDVKTLKALRAVEVRDSIRAKLADQIENIVNYTAIKKQEANA